MVQDIFSNAFSNWGAIGVLFIGMTLVIRWLITRHELMVKQQREDHQQREKIMTELMNKMSSQYEKNLDRFIESNDDVKESLNHNTQAIQLLNQTILKQTNHHA